MAADNSLASQSATDLDEMMQVGSTADVNVVVQIDRPAFDTLPGCRRLLIESGRLRTLGVLGAVDMAAPQTLGDFATFLARNFPAQNYALVIWDHGNGWTFDSASHPKHRSVIIDLSSSQTLSVAEGELAAALRLCRSALGRRIRVLGFDACLMMMVEVAVEAMDYCDFLVAAEGLAPLGGWNYAELIRSLTAHAASSDPSPWLSELCASYVAQYPHEDVTLAAINLRQLASLLNRMAVTVAGLGPDSVVRQARLLAQSFPDSPRSPSPLDEQLDLIHFLHLAQQPLAVALESCVVACATAGRLSQAHGLACWFPLRYLTLKYNYQSYRGLGFSKQVPWLQFVNRFLGRDDIAPTTPQLSLASRGSNRVSLHWTGSFDLAPVSYRVLQCNTQTLLRNDPCESLADWRATGWSLSGTNPRSGNYCFASGSGPNRNDTLELTWSDHPAHLAQFWTRFHTLETEDSTGITRDICLFECLGDHGWQPVDSLFGRQDSWLCCRYLLPGVLGIRFAYRTRSAVGSSNIRIDDLSLYSLPGLVPATPIQTDTFALLDGLERNPNGYFFYVTASDSFGNRAMLSEPKQSRPVLDYAPPYTIPAPFRDSCLIFVDSPTGQFELTIFTVSGNRVRHYPKASSPIHWDGKNENGQPVADGIYLVTAAGPGFRTIGPIAQVKRN